MKLTKFKNFFRSNPGTLFVIAFQVLLVGAIVVLILGSSSTANNVAFFAFCALVIGVAIQVGIVIIDESKRARAIGTSR